MKKITRFIVPLLCVSVLSSCSGPNKKSSSSSEPLPEVKVVNELHLSKMNLGLTLKEEVDADGNPTGKIVGEEYQFEARTYPNQSEASNVTYTSSNPSVASVTSKGLVKAVGEGKCQVIASYDDGRVKDTCDVYVNKGTDIKSVKLVAAKMRDKQDETGMIDAADVLQLKENRFYYRTKNDNYIETEREYETMTMSKSKAFFSIGSTYSTSITENGSSRFSNYQWIFYVNEYYDAYLFHISGETRNYAVVDCTSYIDKGLTPFDALGGVLGSFFINGDTMISRQFEDYFGRGENGALMASTINNASKSEHLGVRGESELMYSFKQTNSMNIADLDDENDYYIPYGTKYKLIVSHDYVATDNVVISDALIQGMEWKQGDDSYSCYYDIEDYHTSQGVDIVFPDINTFAKVDSAAEL